MRFVFGFLLLLTISVGEALASALFGRALFGDTGVIIGYLGGLFVFAPLTGWALEHLRFFDWMQG